MTEPTADGLPNWKTVVALPVALLVVAATLVLLGLNGTSSGALFSSIEQGKDPALLAGTPQAIRSDEWNVGTVWAIAQVETGLASTNASFPGGMDAAILYDLPRTGWDIAFRPHLLGYLFLAVDSATAWRWWVPGLALIATAYVLILTFVPRRPLAAVAIATGFFLSPFFQWWYQPSTFWPAVWACATVSAVWWSMRSSSTTARWVWAIVIFYLSCVMAMGVYAPFIIPVALVVMAAAAGAFVERIKQSGDWKCTLRRLVPITCAGVASIMLSAVWLVTKSSAVAGLLDTAYPGQRLTSTGSGGVLSLARAASSTFSESLVRNDGFLGINASEASTFFLVGIWLLPSIVWVAVRNVRGPAPLPWSALLVGVTVLVFIAFTIVPGWDALAHLMLLDRTTADRARIGLGVASVVLLVLAIKEFDSNGRAAPRGITTAVVAVFVGVQCAIAGAVVIVLGHERLLSDTPTWWLWTLVSATCLVFFSSPRLISAGAGAFLVVSLASSFLVNPIYQGVFDLRETATGAVLSADIDRSPGPWLGVGNPLVTALLLESGAEVFNGTQGAPSRVMWEAVDPTGQFEENWNRIGRVSWVSGEGEPSLSNPAADRIVATFDGCSMFAQTHVDHVLSDIALNDQCLRLVDRFEVASGTLRQYEVVPG